MKSALRLSATLSIRPSGRVQSHRYVLGQHFGLVKLCERTGSNFQLCARDRNRQATKQISKDDDKSRLDRMTALISSRAMGLKTW